MSDKPHALALAETLERCPIGEVDIDAAAELRRLQAQNEQLIEALRGVQRRAAPSGYIGHDGQYLKTLSALLDFTNSPTTPEPR